MEKPKPEESPPLNSSSNDHSKRLDDHLPHLFLHQEITAKLENTPIVRQKIIINTLNLINFKNKHILAHLRHSKYGESILLKAIPEPCLGTELTCRWIDEPAVIQDFQKYEFLNILIDDGHFIILVPAMLQDINKKGITVQLQDRGYAVGHRQARRYPCHGVLAELSQSGLVFKGELLDFSAKGFRISLGIGPSSFLNWYDPDSPVTLNLKRNEQVLYSQLCGFIRQNAIYPDHVEVVIMPEPEGVHRFRQRGLRNLRQRLSSSPMIIFNHPFVKKRVQLDVSDISTSGFSVYEGVDDGLLVPGMIIPELAIHFPGSLNLRGKAQVIYRSEEENEARCGMAILDMDVNNHSRLTDVLLNSLDRHARISNEIDLDELWEFFFDTGFIYPKKYSLIQSYRDQFKETYRKLYQECPEIARHFAYQKNGRILGHISMVRAYDRAWLFHHHSARKMSGIGIGFMVLKQILHYVHDVCRLPSTKMDYFMAYFRPENRFPDRVFGGFFRSPYNKGFCTSDLFTYLYVSNRSVSNQLDGGWSLRPSTELDLWELRRFYEYHSKGLLLSAMAIGQKHADEDSIEHDYEKVHFKRTCRTYSLVNGNELSALLVLNQSDLGISLSEFLNNITIFLINGEHLPWDVLSTAIAQLTDHFKEMRQIPVLLYPSTYADQNGIPYEKRYQAWIYDSKFISELLLYIDKEFRSGYFK